VAFDTGSGSEAPLWHVNLPADTREAARQIAAGEASLEAARRSLNAASCRLDTFVRSQSSGLSFGVARAELSQARPEAQLLKALTEIREGRGAISFSLEEDRATWWTQSAPRIEAFVRRALQFIMHYAWVESEMEGRLLGRTAVSWTGDMDTAWQEDVHPDQAALHQRAVALALASRNTLIRTVIVAVRGAAGLSMAMATPGGAILALPAVWDFINRVTAEG
jgi:hypothetical protein